jgi:hypothetical protein
MKRSFFWKKVRKVKKSLKLQGITGALVDEMFIGRLGQQMPVQIS